MKKIAVLAALVLFEALPASGRAWKPEGQALAQDYSVISDTRPNHEIVNIFWANWPMAGGDANQVIKDLLDRYIIIGVTHGGTEAGGQMSFNSLEPVQVLGLDDRALTELKETDFPAAVAGTVAALTTSMRQTMGAMGSSMRFLVFNSNGIRACEKGRLSVVYAGETYTYDTPIPGCPAP